MITSQGRERREILRFIAAAAALALAPAAPAQDYPHRQAVKIVVPFTPGSSSDTVTRLMADELRKLMGASFIVENRPGAGGMVGTAAVARSPADGYTLLLTSQSTHGLAPWMFKNVSYDAVKDFAHIAKWVEAPFLLAVRPALPTKDLREFVAHARANPGKLSYGYGTSSARLAASMLNLMAGSETLGVPYKSQPPALTDLVAGRIDYIIVDVLAGSPYVASGQLRAVAVTSKTRFENMPQLPTVAESGYPEYEYATWLGAAAPAGTPRAAVDRLSEAMREILVKPELRRRLVAMGMNVVPTSAAEHQAFVQVELEKWGKRIRAMGIQPE